ncbi:MAG: thiamine pyrophosphate-binding protein [Deltaproteobacteria bacterium]|nr:MAG: thiamine pyrophosphate-binding protein [Deltaproteobacteria bacterium]
MLASTAAGLALAGVKPIALAQSSGLANMGSAITSLLKPYNITFAIIISWRTYKEGDSEVQHKHLATQLPKLIDAYGYAYELLDTNSVQTAVAQINASSTSHTICVLQKDTFSQVKLESKNTLDLSAHHKRSEYLLELNEHFANSEHIFIGTTGNTAREMYSFMSETKNFYMAGNMGGALSLGLGLALAGRRVFVCGGDAEFTMHQGGLATAGRYKDLNITYIVFDNEQNKSTGGQASLQSHLDYVGIARACGFNARNIKDLAHFKEFLHQDALGLEFLHIKCDTDEQTPRPPLSVITINKI